MEQTWNLKNLDMYSCLLLLLVLRIVLKYRYVLGQWVMNVAEIHQKNVGVSQNSTFFGNASIPRTPPSSKGILKSFLHLPSCSMSAHRNLISLSATLKLICSMEPSIPQSPPLEACQHVGGRNHEAASGTQAAGAGHTN